MQDTSRTPPLAVTLGPTRIRPGATAIFFSAAHVVEGVDAEGQPKRQYVKFRPKVLVIPPELIEHFEVSAFRMGSLLHADFREPRTPKPELVIEDVVLEAGKQISLSVTSISKEEHEFSATVLGEPA